MIFRSQLIAVGLLACAPLAHGQSTGALRFFGTGIGPPGQQDRVRIPIDDNVPGGVSQPCDVGAGSFTIDFWVRGRLTDNNTASAGGDNESFDFRWIEGNIVIDRDIYGGSDRDWGISLAGGRVRFGVGRGDSGVFLENTIEGSEMVLDDAWRHIACVRDASVGQLRIYVDGSLDYAGTLGVNSADVSYPDAGVSSQVTPWGPYIVLAAEKHDAGAAYPSFNGYMDEVRVWSRALSGSEVAAVRSRVLVSGSPAAAGLVGAFRFEEPSGTAVTDSSGSGQTPGLLINNTPGNGLRVFVSANPLHTAPVIACLADFNGSGGLNLQDIFDFLNAWFSGDGRADINGGGISILDIFDFLNAWFAGC